VRDQKFHRPRSDPIALWIPMRTGKTMKLLLIFVAMLMLSACDQKPNPRIDWPPMDPTWGAGQDGGADAYNEGVKR
jgi:hypothetical protein